MSTKIAFVLFITSTALSFLTAIASSGPVSSPAPSPESYFSPSPTGESGSPTASPPGDDCLTSLYSMYDCQSYVTAGSNLTQPDEACCPELAEVAANHTLCLCQMFGNTTATIGITVDISRVTKLPSLCNVSTPDPSLCALINGNPTSRPPSSGPVSSPAPSPESYFSPSPTGESGSPTASPPGDDCLTSLYSMYDCQSYVTAGSTLTQPDEACCPELADVAENHTLCLCQMFGNTIATLGITVDISRVTKLPSLCNVSTPDPSLCALVNGHPTSLSPSSGLGASPTAGNDKNGAIRTASCSTSTSLVGLATVTMLSMLF